MLHKRLPMFGISALIMFCLFAALMLSGCAKTVTTTVNGVTTTTTTTPVNVTLAVVQSETRAIDGAVDVLAPSLEKSMAGPTLQKAQFGVAALDASAAAIEILQPGTSPVKVLIAFDGAAQTIVGLLPVPQATQTAIEAGLVVNAALLNNPPTASVPTSVTSAPAAMGATLNGVPLPPVAIPLS